MEDWLKKYGSVFDYSTLEIALGIPKGTFTQAQTNDKGIPKEWKQKLEQLMTSMQQELLEQKAAGSAVATFPVKG